MPSGSSPRMRGAVLEHFHGCLCERIIPAHAGSSDVYDCVLSDIVDHPRACGEQGSFVLTTPATAGSSPRMRGAGRFTWSVAWSARIIPAHAGSSRLLGHLYHAFKDHPRACGEQE